MLTCRRGARTNRGCGEVVAVAGDGGSLELVDDVTSATQDVPVPPKSRAPAQVRWQESPGDPDGRRLFWLNDRQSGASGLIDTWQIGDLAAQSLHDIDIHVGGPLVAVAAP